MPLAFVAGATGFTGREVARGLAARGIKTVAHARPDSPRLEEWRERFAQMGAETDATAWDEAALTGTFSRLRPDLVFALLGTTRARMKNAARRSADPKTQDYTTVDYGLTAMLIRAAKHCGSSPRFVYLSAAGVTPKPGSAYYRARGQAEELLRSSGLPYVIARPSFIVGPGRDDRRPGERLGAAMIDGLLDFAALLGAKRFRDRYASTTNVVLAGALVRLALDPGAANKIFESENLR